MSILKATNLGKRFKYPVQMELLKGIDLEVEPGETLAIMGASGEGKSTLLQILGTLEPATSGQVTIMGEEVTPKRAPFLRNTHIGFVFQSFNLLEDYSAFQNVLMPARIGRRPLGPARKRAAELLDRVGLQDRMHHPVKLLSGGEMQRVSIARALCNEPSLLLVDEPSGNLDAKNSESIHRLLMKTAEESSCSLIAVTHDSTLAQLCDKIYTLKAGCISLS